MSAHLPQTKKIYLLIETNYHEIRNIDHSARVIAFFCV